MLETIKDILVNTEPKALSIGREIYLTSRYEVRSLANSAFKGDAKSITLVQQLFKIFHEQFFYPNGEKSYEIANLLQGLDAILLVETVTDQDNIIAFTFHTISKIDVDGHAAVICGHGPSSLIRRKRGQGQGQGNENNSYQGQAILTALHMRMAFAVAMLYPEHPCYGYYAASSPHSFSLSHIFANALHNAESCIDHYPSTHYYPSPYLIPLLKKIFYRSNSPAPDPNRIAIQRDLHARSDYFHNSYHQIVDIMSKQTDQWNFYFTKNTGYDQGYAIPIVYCLNRRVFLRAIEFFKRKGFALQESIHTEFQLDSAIRERVNNARSIGTLAALLPETLHPPLADTSLPRLRTAPIPEAWKTSIPQWNPKLWGILTHFSATATQITIDNDVFTIAMIDPNTAGLVEDFLTHYKRIFSKATVETVSAHFRPLPSDAQLSSDQVFVEKITSKKFVGFNLYRILEMPSALGTVKIVHVGPAFILDNSASIDITSARSTCHQLTLLLTLRFAFRTQLQNAHQPCYLYHKIMFPLIYSNLASAFNQGDYVPHAKFKTPGAVTELLQNIAKRIYPKYQKVLRNGDLMVGSAYTPITETAFSPSVEKLQKIHRNGSIMYLFRFMATNYLDRYGDGYLNGYGLSFLSPLSQKNFNVLSNYFARTFKKLACFEEALASLIPYNRAPFYNDHPGRWFTTQENPDLYQTFPFQHTKELTVFDWDNTLVESRLLREKAITTAFARAAIVPPAANELKWLMEEPLTQALCKIAHTRKQELPSDEIKRLLIVYYETAEKPKLFPNVEKNLRALKDLGMQLALVTHQMSKVIKSELEHLGIASLFSVVNSTDSIPVDIRHPGQKVLENTMTTLNKRGPNTVLVSSTSDGLATAESLRIDAIGVHYDEDYIFLSTRHVARSSNELFKFLLEFSRNPKPFVEQTPHRPFIRAML